jgi:hypothetical protein
MFLLRDELRRHPDSPDFYSGQVACAFNETAACEEKFKKVIAADSNPMTAKQVAKQVHDILTNTFLREGRYARAFGEIDALLAADPNDQDAKDTRPLLEVLSHFPDQAVPENGTSKATAQLDDLNLPLLINGKNASYFFDTGANLSVLTESEALRLGMEIKEVKSTASDINGNKFSIRLAVARSLSLGGVEVDNVAFLVAANDQQPFAGAEPGKGGLIGLPVLRAFGSIKWARGGKVEVDRTPRPANITAANLFFDDLLLIAEASFQRNKLPFTFDTGATTTDLWPKFADVAGDLARKFGTRKTHTVTGFGGSEKYEVTSLPQVILGLGGRSVILRPAHILPTQQREQRKWFYGNLGEDLLGQTQYVSIDFRTMTLELGPPIRHRRRPSSSKR